MLLEIEDLQVEIPYGKMKVYPVSGVSFSLEEGEVLGIIGESGSGKSMAMKAIMGLLPEKAKVSARKLLFQELDLRNLTEKEYLPLRGSCMAMIFQDPMTALNPLIPIGEQLREIFERQRKKNGSSVRTKDTEALSGMDAPILPLTAGNSAGAFLGIKDSKKDFKERAIALLASVGIPNPEEKYKQYPHEFSGGMRQRVLIAMALSCSPALLIADEPTTALDVTLQAQILDLLLEGVKARSTSLILISHDLSLVKERCKRILILYGGKVMEEGTVEEIFQEPKHPYTKALLAAIPSMEKDKEEALVAIEGNPPSILKEFICCPFYERCKERIDACQGSLPEEVRLSENHRVFCHKIFSGGKI
ncbi:ABC transporter ATP-binding protein [Oribacterium sinus]|uniref:ABC transporter ATP-binding protein n=1 Tax=Oribacterium sinus TaxID=237576 RepID=UPI0028E9D1C4|nr:ABC transporter ATP-binding protein [Oribacterium sinus]